MKLDNFKKRLRGYPYFTSAIFSALPGSEKTLYNQMDRWVKAGYVVRLRRGLYTLNSDDRRAGLSLRLIANILYSPSYVSLEFALSHYGMIPEAVFAVTSVTTRKTQEFTNPFGRFIYRSIREAAFFGFEAARDEFGNDSLIAVPEKALLDYLYFNAPPGGRIDETFFDDSMRLQNAEQLDLDSMEEMAKRMGASKLDEAVSALKRWVKA